MAFLKVYPLPYKMLHDLVKNIIGMVLGDPINNPNKSTRSEQIGWLRYIDLLLHYVGIIPCTYAIVATCMNRHGSPLSVIKVKVKITQSCPTLCDPMDYIVHGIPWNSSAQNTGVGSLSLLQGIFQPRDRTQVSRMAGGFFTSWAPPPTDAL